MTRLGTSTLTALGLDARQHLLGALLPIIVRAGGLNLIPELLKQRVSQAKVTLLDRKRVVWLQLKDPLFTELGVLLKTFENRLIVAQ